nr:bis(5'-nucleosyl)-tetraphosphatase (symmetrical) YqeK [Gloeocapsopsis dulcis]
MKSIERDRVLAWLADNVPQSRIQHILRVEQMAIALAEHHQIDVEKAAKAALMHDLAKNFKSQKLLAMAQAEGLAIDPISEVNPHLLHADVGALVARDTFNVDDAEVLQAIANHTCGQPGMSTLSCIVFLADSLEPGRGDTPELAELRKTSYHNLEQAVWLTCDYSLKLLVETHRLIHPRTVATRNWFLQKVKNSQRVVDKTA